VSRAEHFFISSLESWRIASGLEKIVLVGHSLGGYLATAYTVRYPERVSGLILVSPAGIPRGPEYKRFKTSAEGLERERAADAVEMEMDGDMDGENDPVVPKGEAKNWGKNQTAFRRGATKCERLNPNEMLCLY
jgi:cardiolipin-specific phospholipase